MKRHRGLRGRRVTYNNNPRNPRKIHETAQTTNIYKVIKLPFEFKQIEFDMMTPESERKLATIIPGIEQFFDDDQKAYEGLYEMIEQYLAKTYEALMKIHPMTKGDAMLVEVIAGEIEIVHSMMKYDKQNAMVFHLGVIDREFKRLKRMNVSGIS